MRANSVMRPGGTQFEGQCAADPSLLYYLKRSLGKLFDMWARGVTNVYRKTQKGSWAAGGDSLKGMGFDISG